MSFFYWGKDICSKYGILNFRTSLYERFVFNAFQCDFQVKSKF